MDKTLAERLTARRQELGLRQADLAEVAGVSEAAVSQWENGKTKNLRLDHLFRIADALKVHARWLGVGQGPKYMAVLLSLAVPPLLVSAMRDLSCVLCKIGKRDKAQSFTPEFSLP